MTGSLVGQNFWYVEFVVPFVFEGELFAEGGMLVVWPDGQRTAVTRGHFKRWWR